MATTSAGNPYVESSDLVANYPATSLALANRLDKYAVNPFADATARDAAIPTPVQGQLAQTLDDNKVWRYDGTAWAPFSGAVGAANFTNTATGTYTDGGIDYKYITFTGTGNIEFDVAGFADCLVVGGGGAGGSVGGGGGGGGGVNLFENYFFNTGTFTCIIGAGGSPSKNIGVGNNGNSSSVGPLVGVAGGGGGAATGYSGLNGGSGGGAIGINGLNALGGSGFYPQGHDGGIGTQTANYGSGGGGGFAAVGANGTTAAGGDGGLGLVGNLFTGSPQDYAGGGGGAPYAGGTAGIGTQGGGTASTTGIGGNGSPNSWGGGAGGAAYTFKGGSGGSGSVTIRVVV